MKYLAHISEGGREQTVKEHLSGTSKLCGEYAKMFGCEDQGKLVGMMHDIGKYSEGFQRRLEGGVKVDHSTAGAYECYKCGQVPEAFCIAGHHGGLPDGGSRADASGSSFFARMNKAKNGLIPDYSAWEGRIEYLKTTPPGFCRKAPEAMFFTRMLFSCLTDADYTDTESFMTGIVREECISDMATLNEKLDSYTQKWYPPKGELNTKRCAILNCCKETGSDTDRGVFALTVPTGGGKTVASLAFALHHAKRNGMRRIIYVIPYTSIIEQTAESFREILGAGNVLEHHSGVLFDIDENSTEEDIKRAHASENWEIPVVVTTAVQFFESLFSNRPSKCRKLHNIANSVVVFDEAQMLPLPYLRPCVFAISQLYEHYRVSAVLCTATQPNLNKLFGEYLPQTEIAEICPSEYFDDDVFHRVVFRKAGKMSWDDICGEMNGVGQVLCIVNSRKNAKELFDGLDEDGRYHLSTLMYMDFYILGISPNAARLSVRFFYHNSFGKIMENVNRHYERLEIVKPKYAEGRVMSVWRLAYETVNHNSRDKSPTPLLAGELIRSVISDSRYPVALLNGVNLRIRAEHDISYGKAAIIKAYYIKNPHIDVPEEVLTVSLNENSTNTAYNLGRLFSVLEAIQERANPRINATIKDKYFNSASATPAVVFPVLVNLAQKHLKKLEGGIKVFYEKQLGEITDKLPEDYPAHMNLPQQGSFQLGYYHQTQARYTHTDKEDK